MAEWCKHCDGKGKVPGCYIPAAVAGKEVWIDVPARPCIYCFGQGVFKAGDKPLFIPPEQQTS